MKDATFYNLYWEKAESPYVMQGVKGNQEPKGALHGSNGSFMVAGDPAKLYLTVIDADGKTYRNNVYDRVMKLTGRKRMSEKLYNKIYEQFENAEFTVDARRNISWSCKLG